METEIWKDIIGYEGLYQISSLGRIKSMQRVCNRFAKKIIPETIMKNSICRGYRIAQVSKNGKKYYFRIGRLVGKMFIPNPLNLPEINHKKGIKHDDRASELEWVTTSQNQIHSIKVLGRKKTINESQKKPVIKISLDGFILQEYSSISDAARDNKLFNKSIRFCMMGKQKSAGGFVWA